MQFLYNIDIKSLKKHFKEKYGWKVGKKLIIDSIAQSSPTEFICSRHKSKDEQINALYTEHEMRAFMDTLHKDTF